MPAAVSTIRYRSFPSTEAPPPIATQMVEVFREHESGIATLLGRKLKSDEVLASLAGDLRRIGFAVELGKRRSETIRRPVFFGENGKPTLQYSVDAFHAEQGCGLEIEAARGWLGNAVYRDIVQALVMVDVKHLVVGVANCYTFRSAGRSVSSRDYDCAVDVCAALYGHSRVAMPYGMTVVGY